MTSPRPAPGSVILNLSMLWLAIAIASVALWPIYSTAWLTVMVAGAVLIGSAIALGGALARWRAPAVATVTVFAFVLVGVPLAVPGQARLGVVPTLQGLRDLVSGVALGWKRLLTISLPVGTFEALLVPFFALILLITVLSLSIALRTRRPGYAVFGPVVLYGAALLFGPSVPRYPVLLTLALGAVVVVWSSLQRWYLRRSLVRSSLALAAEQSSNAAVGGAGVRAAASALVILVVAGSVAAGATAVFAPRGERDALRSVVAQPFRPAEYVSPLSTFRKFWAEPAVDEVLFTISGLPVDSRIRIATLDSYNGIIYSVGDAEDSSASGTFTRVPYEFDQSAVGGETITLQVDVDALTGPWVPTVGSLESVNFDGVDAAARKSSFFYNNTSGTAAVVDGLSSSDSYTLTAVNPAQPEASELSGLVPGTEPVPAVTGVPDDISVAMQRYTAQATTPGEQLVAIIDGLRADGYVSHGLEDEPASRSGHAADRLTELLTEQQMIGDGEQYAVAAALMARAAGFPARVVFGFAPQSGSETIAVTGSDVSAWIEVDTTEFGWVAIDPNPDIREIPPELPQETTTIARPETVILPPAAEPAPADAQETPRVQENEADDADETAALLFVIVQWVAVLALALLVVLAPFLAVVLAKMRRRGLRRRAPDNLARITGAWLEFEDAALDHGYRPPASATRSEVASTVGGARAAVLAAVTDRAVFAPSEPDRVEADRVWRAVGELNASLDAAVTRWERIKAGVSLASLGGYSGRKRNARGGERS